MINLEEMKENSDDENESSIRESDESSQNGLLVANQSRHSSK